MAEPNIIDGEVVEDFIPERPEDDPMFQQKQATIERHEKFKSNQWKPGQSGNPGGMPKKKHFREALMRVMLGKDTTLGSSRTRLERLITAAFREAMEGKVKDKIDFIRICAPIMDGKYTAIDLDAAEEPQPTVTINVLQTTRKDDDE